MSTVAQVDGLAGALLRCVENPDRIPLIQALLDRYCHRLRNRLNSMKLSLYLARRLSENPSGAQWARADSAYRSMEVMVEQLQLFFQPLHPSITVGDLNQWIVERLPDWRRLLSAHSIELDADGPGEAIPSSFDWNRLAQGLNALFENWIAQGVPEDTIRLSWGRGPDQFQIRFDAEGSLVRSNCEFENLALPILARVLRVHQGSLAISADGSSIELNWPADRL